MSRPTRKQPQLVVVLYQLLVHYLHVLNVRLLVASHRSQNRTFLQVRRARNLGGDWFHANDRREIRQSVGEFHSVAEAAAAAEIGGRVVLFELLSGKRGGGGGLDTGSRGGNQDGE